MTQKHIKFNYKKSEIKEIEHEHEWVDATCQTPKTCKVCNETEGKPLEHTESSWIIDKEATCQEEGKKHKECTVCHEKLEEEVIEKLAHEWENATCQAPKTCKVCGVTEGEKLQHSESAWIIDSEATCEKEGKQQKVCTECHEVLQEETIAKKEHTWNDATTESPKKCSVCGVTEGEKLPEPSKKKNCKNCKKTTVALILTSITLLCTSVYVFRKKR